MTAWDELSESTKDLLFVALDHALKNAEISADGFTPFTLAEKIDGTRGLARFVAGDGGDLTESVRAGRQALKSMPPGTVAVTLAWDGYLTKDGERNEAVYVEAHQIGMNQGVRVGQPYTRLNGRVQALGNPVLVEETEPLVETVSTEQP